MWENDGDDLENLGLNEVFDDLRAMRADDYEGFGENDEDDFDEDDDFDDDDDFDEDEDDEDDWNEDEDDDDDFDDDDDDFSDDY